MVNGRPIYDRYNDRHCQRKLSKAVLGMTLTRCIGSMRNTSYAAEQRLLGTVVHT